MSITHVLRTLILVGSMAASALSPLLAQAASAEDWVIKKSRWDEADEKAYSEFIQVLGEKGCVKGKACNIDVILKSAANPYRGSDPAGLSFKDQQVDCGRFPYVLRGYFAWKNGLPFSYVDAIKSADADSNDTRYSKEGNIATHRVDLTQSSPGQRINGVKALKEMVNSINTSMHRFNPKLDNQKNLFFDFYSVAITRQAIRPGTVLYDPAGHVAVVYRVEDKGVIKLFDAHPDNSVSHIEYGEKFERSRPGHGAGFKNWRPIYLAEAAELADGSVLGGQVRTWPNAQLPSYSVEQYFGTNPSADGKWANGKFVVNGKELGYYDFVRTRLAVGDLKYQPVEELRSAMEDLCNDLTERKLAVETAIKADIQKQAQPGNLPNNIYGTSGDWETYSTPSRDARLKTSFRALRLNIQKMVEMYKQGSPRIDYQGTNLGADLRAAYEEKAKECVIEYTRTEGSVTRLSYDDIVERLFALSFDPYHCVEHRWGAMSAAELSTCRDGSVKQDWYAAEQRLRNQTERTYDAKMSFSLEQLRSGVAGSGVSEAPDVDLRKYLRDL